jgi:serine phosphatase RsbU (regulator of sigma subunit)
MDVALIKIEPDRRKVAFAGAHRPLYHLQKGEMQEIKGERLSIGGTQYSSSGRKVEFQTTEIASEPGDLFFLGSDGYQDQIGGEEKKKFRSKQLRDLLAGVNGHSMETVGQQVEETFDHWKGDEPQMDDVLLMGVRI